MKTKIINNHKVNKLKGKKHIVRLMESKHKNNKKLISIKTNRKIKKTLSHR
jgi:hypothetical protein